MVKTMLEVSDNVVFIKVPHKVWAHEVPRCRTFAGDRSAANDIYIYIYMAWLRQLGPQHQPIMQSLTSCLRLSNDSNPSVLTGVWGRHYTRFRFRFFIVSIITTDEIIIPDNNLLICIICRRQVLLLFRAYHSTIRIFGTFMGNGGASSKVGPRVRVKLIR